MKRLIAAGVLIVLVMVSYIFSLIYIKDTCKEVEKLIIECETEYENGKNAEETAEKLTELWDEKEKWISFFVNHNRVDDIEMEISSLTVYSKTDEKAMFSEHIDNLKMQLHQLKEDIEISTHSIF